jgi:hypothetical protein
MLSSAFRRTLQLYGTQKGRKNGRPRPKIEKVAIPPKVLSIVESVIVTKCISEAHWLLVAWSSRINGGNE